MEKKDYIKNIYRKKDYRTRDPKGEENYSFIRYLYFRLNTKCQTGYPRCSPSEHYYNCDLWSKLGCIPSQLADSKMHTYIMENCPFSNTICGTKAKRGGRQRDICSPNIRALLRQQLQQDCYDMIGRECELITDCSKRCFAD